MKKHPILFSAPMVRAILAGTKTQTRRVVKHPAIADLSFVVNCGDGWWGDEEGDVQVRCPYGKPGDRLWVRETFYEEFGRAPKDEQERMDWIESGYLAYRASDDQPYGSGGYLPWRPSIHMPRWASRITLEVTGVRVERLQDISEADAVAEGCTRNHNNYYWGGPHKAGGLKQMASAKQAYQDLWESINGPDSWDANPWVWVLEFKPLEGGAA